MTYRARTLENFGPRYYLTDGYVTTEPQDWSLELVDHGQAALLLETNSNQLYMWRKRSERNGFPDPIAQKPPNGRKRGRDLWLASEVLDWKAGYIPSKGGRRRAGD